MAQQQLVLLVVGIVVVTIAIAAGMLSFSENAIAANRQAMAGDMQRVAAMAQGYYHRPAILGGGEGSFAGLRLALRNPNGTYTVSEVNPDQVVVVGRGREKGSDGSPLSMKMIITADTVLLSTRN